MSMGCRRSPHAAVTKLLEDDPLPVIVKRQWGCSDEPDELAIRVSLTHIFQ